MATGLVKYEWRTGDGQAGWFLPGSPRAAIQLRTSPQIADPSSTGYAIAEYDGDLPPDSVSLGSRNVDLDRSAIESTLGFRPEGTTIPQMIRSLVVDGPDDANLDRWRPLRCSRPDKFEIHFGEKLEFPVSYTDRLRQGVYVRGDLEVALKAVEDGRVPPDTHRKMLWAEAKRLGIDWQTLRPKSKRWNRETPVAPTTTYTETFTSATTVRLNAYAGWTVNGEQPLRFRVFSDGRLIFDGGSLEYLPAYQSVYGWHPGVFPVANMEASLAGVSTSNTSSPFSLIARGDGSTSGYLSDSYNGSSRVAVMVGNVFTQLAAVASSAGPLTLRIRVNGSTIQTADAAGEWQHSITDMLLTSGGRFGLHGYSATSFREASGDLWAEDILPAIPVVTNNSASAVQGVGGTAQMAASNSPTSWSLTGTPPTGASINSSGLVTWTSATPAAVHTIGVRATNAGGSGDGTLTLTIIGNGSTSVAFLNVTSRRR